jgi:hypothetical protein
MEPLRTGAGWMPCRSRILRTVDCETFVAMLIKHWSKNIYMNDFNPPGYKQLIETNTIASISPMSFSRPIFASELLCQVLN